jgi:hypothetical protein
MARSRGPVRWKTNLLYILCLVTVALSRNLGSPGNRPRSENSPASSNSTTFQSVTPEGSASCPAPGIKPPTFNRTLQRRALSFNELVDEGYKNICYQAAFEAGIPQSMWMSENYDQLAKYGWVVMNRNSDALNVFADLPMSAVTKPWPQGIGMAVTAPPLIGSSFVHVRESQGLPKNYHVSTVQALSFSQGQLTDFFQSPPSHPTPPPWTSKPA